MDKQKMPLISGGGIAQTRAVLLGRIEYKNSFRELLAKFTGGSLAIGAGLSLGREGPSIQMGSYIGHLICKITKIKKGDQNHLIAAGAGAGLAAAFSAPLSGAIMVIESLERFDAPKTSITTLLAGLVAGLMSDLVFQINVFDQINALNPSFSIVQNLLIFGGFAILISFLGKCYYEMLLYTKHKYPKVNLSLPIKILIVSAVTYFFCLFFVDLTGGGQSFLISEAVDKNYNLWSVSILMILHLLFTSLSYSLAIPGGIFVPLLVTGGLIGKIYALTLLQFGLIGPENIGYFILIGMAVFIIAIIRTPITAIILITEITGHFEVFFASVIVGSMTYYLTQILQMKPLDIIFYHDLINKPGVKITGKKTIHLSVMPGSFLDKKEVSSLKLPNDCLLTGIYRNKELLTNLNSQIIQDGDQLDIEINVDDIEKLHEPLMGMANVY